jgi:hypothetical protein
MESPPCDCGPGHVPRCEPWQRREKAVNICVRSGWKSEYIDGIIGTVRHVVMVQNSSWPLHVQVNDHLSGVKMNIHHSLPFDSNPFGRLFSLFSIPSSEIQT